MATDRTLHVRLIEWGSADYAQERQLRDDVLRKPLGLTLALDHAADEQQDFHLGAFRGSRLVGTLLLSDRGDHLKMRQVAVDEAARGEGVGTLLVQHAERLAASQGYRRIELHARRTAVPFYLKNGYQAIGAEFVEVGIPHLRMVKSLPGDLSAPDQSVGSGSH